MKQYSKKGSIVKEDKNQKEPIASIEQRIAETKRIQKSLIRGKVKQEKYFVDQKRLPLEFERFENELYKILKYLDELKLEAKHYTNIKDLIGGYIVYVYTNAKNFDVVEFRKFRKGAILLINNMINASIEEGFSRTQKREIIL